MDEESRARGQVKTLGTYIDSWRRTGATSGGNSPEMRTRLALSCLRWRRITLPRRSGELDAMAYFVKGQQSIRRALAAVRRPTTHRVEQRSR